MLDRPAGTTEASRTARRERQPHEREPDTAALSAATVIAILRRRKWPFLASTVLCPLLAFIALSQLTPNYTASGTLLYDAAEYNVRELQSILRVDPITDAVMATQAEVLRGMPVVEQVATRLNLFANPDFNPALRPQPWLRRAFHRMVGAADVTVPDIMGPQLDPSRNATLAAVHAALVVTPLKASHVLEVSFTARDPVLAAAAANHAMDAYVKARLGAKYGAVMRARDWLEQRAKELRVEVRHYEDEIAKYRAEHGLVEGMHAGLDSEQISLLSENLARARNALAEAEGRLDAASGRAGAAAQAAIAPSVAPLRARQGQLTAELQSKLGRLGPNHPDIQATRVQLAETDRSIAAEIARVVAATDADVRADRDRVAKLQIDLENVRAQLQRNAQAQVPLNAMQRDADASRSLLLSVLERIQQTTQQSAIEAPDAHEISLALPPSQPSFPRTGSWMAGAVASGVLFGLLLVYLWELTDASFHSGDDIRSTLGLPCLALIPRVGRRELKGMAVEEYAARKPLSPFAEQLRALRAGLSLWPNQPRVVAITAARPSEGKTVVTKALGRLAASNGDHVVVVNCDIRQPNPGPEIGLVDCLLDRATLADVIRRDPATGMAYIPCGRWETNAFGLLTSAAMVRLLQVLREEYDLVLLDTPPAEAITDARIVAGLADATLLCVRWRATSRHVALHALGLLEEAHANVVGAALTQVDVNVHVRSGYADAEVYHPRYGSYFRE
jgi:capsular exopolysaccharide synthesis family protein